MKIYGVSESQIEKIIESIPNLDWKRLETVGPRRPHVEVTLKVKSSRGLYAKRGVGGRRTVAACFHGHAAFMKAVFAIRPGALIKSTMATWDGAADFAERFEDVGERNIGSRMEPIAFRDSCSCVGR